MKRLLVILTLALAACTPSVGDTYGDWTKVNTDTWYAEISLPNGQMVPCLVWSSSLSAKGGLSCDWSAR